MSKRIEDIKKKAQEDIARVEREEELRPLLPEAEREKAFVHYHKHFASVRLGEDFNTQRSFTEAVALLKALGETVACEHWKGGTMSTYPPAAFGEQEKDHSRDEFIGSFHVRIDIERIGRRSPRTQIEAWFQMDKHLVCIAIPFTPHSGPRSLLPHIQYNSFGAEIGEPQWSGIGEDHSHKWWTSGNGYKRSRHWYSDDSFEHWYETWKEQQNEKHRVHQETV